MSKTLITGAKGMLGNMLGKVFAVEKPTLWDRDELDITNLEQVRKKIGELKPEVIVNTAAYTDVDGAESDRELAFAVNETGVKNLAAVAKEIGAVLIHYSTDYVFPGDRHEGYSEHDMPGPAVNVYGKSKLAGERALQEITPKYYLIRTAWLYGPGGKNFVETMLKLGSSPSTGSGLQPALRVVDDQHGSPTFTKDVAQFSQQLLVRKHAPGIYHATNSGQATWYAFAQEIFRLANIDTKLEPVTSAEFLRPAKRPQYTILKNTKGPTLRPWQDALKEYIENR